MLLSAAALPFQLAGSKLAAAAAADGSDDEQEPEDDAAAPSKPVKAPAAEPAAAPTQRAKQSLLVQVRPPHPHTRSNPSMPAACVQGTRHLHACSAAITKGCSRASS